MIKSDSRVLVDTAMTGYKRGTLISAARRTSNVSARETLEGAKARISANPKIQLFAQAVLGGHDPHLPAAGVRGRRPGGPAPV